MSSGGPEPVRASSSRAARWALVNWTWASAGPRLPRGGDQFSRVDQVSQDRLQQGRPHDLAARRDHGGPGQRPARLPPLEFLPDRLHHAAGKSTPAAPVCIGNRTVTGSADGDDRPVGRSVPRPTPVVATTADTGSPPRRQWGLGDVVERGHQPREPITLIGLIQRRAGQLEISDPRRPTGSQGSSTRPPATVSAGDTRRRMNR